MTTPFPGLLIIYSLFLILPMQLFGVDIDAINFEELGIILEQTLCYDFNVPLEIGNVLIWKISGNHEPFTPLLYSGKDIQFGSGETYLLLTQKYIQEMTVYYWLGTYSSLINAQIAAKYAILLSEFLKTVSIYRSDRIFIAREVEGMESDSFQHTIMMFNRHAAPRDESNYYIKYLDSTFPSTLPNLYVIIPLVKKIPLSLGLQWLRNNDMCILLEMGYTFQDMAPIYIFCGAEVNEEDVEEARKLSQQFYVYFERNLEGKIRLVENIRTSYDFKKLIEVLEDRRHYKFYETNDSGDQPKSVTEIEVNHNEESLSFRVSNDGSKLIAIVTDEYYDSEDDDEKVGVFIDNKSAKGALLILGKIQDIVSRVKGIQLAEEYLDKMYPVSSRIKKMMKVIGCNANP